MFAKWLDMHNVRYVVQAAGVLAEPTVAGLLLLKMLWSQRQEGGDAMGTIIVI